MQSAILSFNTRQAVNDHKIGFFACNYSAEPKKTSQQGADGLFSGHLSAGSAYIATMDGLSGPVNDSLAPDFRTSE